MNVRTMGALIKKEWETQRHDGKKGGGEVRGVLAVDR